MKTVVYNSKNIHNSFITVILYIITFPVTEPDFGIGLDDSYFWAFNYLFFHNYTALREMTYPYGPLAFLRNPVAVGYTFEYSLIFYSALKMWFIYKFIYLADKFKTNTIPVFLILLFALLFLYIDHFLIGLCFIYSLEFLYQRKKLHLILASLIASVALFIKSSIGVSCFSLLFVAWVLDYIKYKKILFSFQFAIIPVLILFIFGCLVFFNIQLLALYVYNIFRFSLNYSTGLSVYRTNNWWYLAIVVLCVFFPLIIGKDNRTKIAFLLFLPALFASWKHAMTRQDDSHLEIFFYFLFLFWGFFLIISEIKAVKIIILASLSILLFYANMNRSWNLNLIQVYVNRIENFNKTVINFKSHKEKFANKSKVNIQPNKINQDVISIIGDASIDAYPWELSYFAVNDELNWKTRRTLQSGSYARWLDQYNAEDFNNSNGPEYLIFHYVPDERGGNFGSIDNRYLLNDNPLAIYAIFNHYRLRLKNDKFLLLQKCNLNNLQMSHKSQLYKTQWDKWISIPGNDNEITRICLYTEETLKGKIKNFFYQSEQHYIDYLTQDGKQFTYRFIPQHAKDGLWINPFIRNPQSDHQGDKISKIRFRCSNPEFNKTNIQYQIESLNYIPNNQPADFNSYFIKNQITVD